MKLLSSGDSNAKTKKNLRETVILYLSPSTQNDKGVNLCPKASEGCLASCLFTAGMGAFSNVQQARINKANYYINDRFTFVMQIRNEIIRKARRTDGELAVRLNGTSDIRWENEGFTDFDGKHYNNLMERFPQVQFYDYTKIANRKDLPKNYDLTFSYSGAKTFSKYNDIAIKQNMRIAAVFRFEKDIPSTFQGMPVIGGDNSDVRHIEPKAHIVALYAKGKAIKDNSGFVI